MITRNNVAWFQQKEAVLNVKISDTFLFIDAIKMIFNVFYCINKIFYCLQ